MSVLRSYRFRVKTSSETFAQENRTFNSNNLIIFFQGEKGRTQPIILSLKTLQKNMIYENTIDLIDVGYFSLVHIKLDGHNVRWKLNSIELEQNENVLFNFPINRWLDSNRNPNIDIILNEGPAQFAPIYTIIIHTGIVSSSSETNIHIALIGDSASTVPFSFNSRSNFFRSGSRDIFQISSIETVDIGQLFNLQIRCDCWDQLPYYCESVEVINNINDKVYFFLVNRWFGPSLEKYVSVSVTDRERETNIFTIAIKTDDISHIASENAVYIHMDFANGKSVENVLNSSETHKTPFRKENIDFFLVSIDDIGSSEIVNVKICFVNKSKDFESIEIYWNCAWIQIRDTFYQRNYCYVTPSKTITSHVDVTWNNYTNLERISDLPGTQNRMKIRKSMEKQTK